MAKDFAKAFYASKKWKACREAYIKNRINVDGALCERCHELPGYILHHKVTLTPLNIGDPDITLNPCRLEYLCKDCHDNEHYEDIHGTARKSYVMFNEKGEIIPTDSRG